jgi:hypothetical protein
LIQSNAFVPPRRLEDDLTDLIDVKRIAKGVPNADAPSTPRKICFGPALY